jgi:hypothetical protein
MNTKLVNGPVNAFRLEGKIGDIDKIFYFFGDIHNPINLETKCDSYTSDDFINFFYKTMLTTDPKITYDFIHENFYDLDMFETGKYTSYIYRQKYITEITKYISSDMNVKTEKNNLKNIGSKTFSNLRLHYLDVRNFYDAFDTNAMPQNIEYKLKQYDFSSFSYKIIETAIIDFSNLKNEIKFLLNYMSVYGKNKEKKFKNIIEINDKYIEEQIKLYIATIPSKQQRMDKYSKKIFEKYKHIEIRDKLIKSSIFKDIFKLGKILIGKINYCIHKLLKMKEIGHINYVSLNKKSDGEYDYGIDMINMKKLLAAVYIKNDEISDNIIHIYSNITDLYCLRRILDKDYITHGIIYSGIYHTNNYIQTLVRDFGFKITNFEYSILSLDETNKLLMSGKEYDYAQIFFKPTFKQCTDMSKFPDKFQ